MTLDSEQDRQFLIEMLGKAQIVGAMAPTVMRMFAKLQQAVVVDENQPKANGDLSDAGILDRPVKSESVKQGKEKT